MNGNSLVNLPAQSPALAASDFQWEQWTALDNRPKLFTPNVGGGGHDDAN